MRSKKLRQQPKLEPVTPQHIRRYRRALWGLELGALASIGVMTATVSLASHGFWPAILPFSGVGAYTTIDSVLRFYGRRPPLADWRRSYAKTMAVGALLSLPFLAWELWRF